ncbi:MAG: MarR family transcriptional regulator [Victivallales bacterium]|jgi:DNA-binding MarR family transcriptional regulator|nr:MarR family transcriptional regulator [Victivallales bacterium]
MPEAKFAQELEKLYHRLHSIKCEAIDIYWSKLEEPHPFESISRMQILLLLRIAEVVPCPLRQITDRTGLTKGAVSIATRKLQERRLLIMSTGDEDRRKRIIDLTTHARKHVENIDQLFDSLWQKRLQQYNDDDFDGFCHKLRHINRVLSDEDANCLVE